jgi:hypothetical protein
MSAPGPGTPGGDDEGRAAVLRCVRAVLGREPAAAERVGGGLGLRRFYRVTFASGDPRSLVARVDAPPDPARWPAGVPHEPPLEPLRSFLSDQGLPVPARYGGDDRAGIDLLEDAGAVSLRDAIPSLDPATRRALYEEACDLVPRYQRAEDPTGRIPSFRVRLGRPFFAYKAEFFARWSLPQALGREPTDAERDAVRAAFLAVEEAVSDAPFRLAHRDLQSANLHLRPGAPAGRRLVLLDLQGAFLAPPEYDLVCLLRDSYVELADDELRHQLDRIRPRLPDAPDAAAFARRFDLLTLSRKGKDHALCHFTAATRGDDSQLAHLPRIVRALRPAAARCAALDPRLAHFSEIVARLPETPCAR